MNGREISLTILFPVVAALFIILGILILLKDKKYWGNRCFALFFWVTALTLILNVTYLYIYDTKIIASLNLITAEAAIVGIIALLLGILVIYKGEDEIIHNKLTYFFIIGMIALFIIQAFIRDSIYFKIEESGYDPFWSIPFGLYEFVFSQSLILAIFYFSFQLYKELSSEMRKKFKFYLIGVVFLDLTLISITIDNMDIIQGFQTIANLLNIFIVIGALFIYYGIVRR